jgi:hypothetical protein
MKARQEGKIYFSKMRRKLLPASPFQTLNLGNNGNFARALSRQKNLFSTTPNGQFFVLQIL